MDEIKISTWDDVLADRDLWKTRFEILKDVVRDHRASSLILEEFEKRLKRQQEENHVG